jgi:hypothetical protein
MAGMRRQRAGERHALLLAARQLRGIMRQSLPEPDLLQLRPGAVESVRRAGEFERNGDVFQRRHRRDEMERLEHDADVLAAKAGKLVLAQRVDSRPRRRWILPLSGRSSPAMAISSVDFPDPDGPTRPIASPRPILSETPLRI